MTANMLTARMQQAQPVTRDLEEFVEAANNMGWVRASRNPYFIAERVNHDGTITRFMDRKG